MEVVFSTNSGSIEALIPKPLELITNKYYVSLTMVNMISTISPDEALSQPDACQYRECLIKIYCQFNGKPYWYVPVSWVTTDFSLLRGFLMGFGKRLGEIHLTQFHPLNTLVPEKKKGSTLHGICSSRNDIHAEMSVKLQTIASDWMFAGTGMAVMKHFPGDTVNDTPLIHQLVELSVENYVQKDLWLAHGEIKQLTSRFSEINSLQPHEIVGARVASEGFKLLGTKLLYNYLESEK